MTGYQHVCSGPGDACIYTNTHALAAPQGPPHFPDAAPSVASSDVAPPGPPETCWMCGRLLQGSQYEWRVKVWNDDSLIYSATVDALVCALCAGRASAVLHAERNALAPLRHLINT